MAKPWRPVLGDMVRFTQHFERPSAAECEAGVEGDVDQIWLLPRENPVPYMAAVVIGVVRKPVVADLVTEGDHSWFVWNPKNGRTFYVLKQTLRGRRFMVPIEDLTAVLETSPVRVHSGAVGLQVWFDGHGKRLTFTSRDDGATWTPGVEILPAGDPWPADARRIAAAHMIQVEVIDGGVYGRCCYCSHSGVLLHPDPTGQEPFVCSDCMK